MKKIIAATFNGLKKKLVFLVLIVMTLTVIVNSAVAAYQRKTLVYTDGVAEAMDRSRRQFGLERIISTLNSNKKAAPRDILEKISAAVDEFVDGAEQFDDLTMLCLEYRSTAS